MTLWACLCRPAPRSPDDGCNVFQDRWRKGSYTHADSSSGSHVRTHGPASAPLALEENWANNDGWVLLAKPEALARQRQGQDGASRKHVLTFAFGDLGDVEVPIVTTIAMAATDKGETNETGDEILDDMGDEVLDEGDELYIPQVIRAQYLDMQL